MSAARWGWHRLDDSWARRVVAAAGIVRGETVYDLGAGDGALTAALARRGDRVVAVELHPVRVAALRRRFAGVPAVRVVAADLTQLRFPRGPFRVVANPPFVGSSPLLWRLLNDSSGLTAADLVLQRGVTRRLVTGSFPGERRWRRRYGTAAGLVIPRSAFRPAPRVDSQVLVVRRLPSRPRA